MMNTGERLKMFPNINFKINAVALAMGLMAVFVGLIATTANPVLIALLIGVMGGVVLLLASRLSIWILLIFGLSSGFFVSLVPGLNKLPWALALLSMLLLLPVSIKFIESKNIPVFVWVALVFMLYALLVTVIQWHSMSQLLAGFKRYFQMYGLMFALVLLVFRPEDYHRWLKLILIIALIQLPFALYERFILVSLRGGIDSVGGAVATDVVAGTLGANLEGGSANAEMAAFLIMSLAFLGSRWMAGLIVKSRALWLGLLCLLPLALGETKVVIILIPLVWFILMREQLTRNPVRFLIQLFGLSIFTAALGGIYLSLNQGSVKDVFNQTLSYNFGTQGYGTNILNRTTVLSFWWDNHSWKDPLALLFGHGLGSSYYTPLNPVPGHIAVKYYHYGIDLTSASTILWDIGLLGLILFLSILVTAWSAAGKLYKTSVNVAVRADALAIQACICIFLVFVFYGNTLVNYLPFEVIFASVLGYLGYLLRSQRNLLSRVNS